MNNTETPAERVAGTLALDIYEGRIKPGTPVPSPDELMSAFGVLRPTAIAALTRMKRAGLLRGDQSGAMYVLTDSSPGLAVTAAAAMCSRLAAQAGNASDGRQYIADLGELRENFLSAARRAMRDNITQQDPAVVAAREVLVRGGQVADPAQSGVAPSDAAPPGRDRLIEEAAERFPEYSYLDQQQAAIDADARANWNGFAYPPYEGPGYTEPPVNWEGWHTDHSEFVRDHYWEPGSDHAGLAAAHIAGHEDIPEALREDSSPSAGPAPGPPPTRQNETTARHRQGTANSSQNGPDSTEGAGGLPVDPSVDFPNPVTPGIGARRSARPRTVGESSRPATRRTL